ncbi:MAG: hypothetical protein H8E13_12215 [Actinobacteria bacterium]|nr:hypothetical protein [Actinomycetota bacterium]
MKKLELRKIIKEELLKEESISKMVETGNLNGLVKLLTKYYKNLSKSKDVATNNRIINDLIYVAVAIKDLLTGLKK